MQKTRRLFPVLLLLLALVPRPALAAEFRAESSTQYLWYLDPFKNDKESDVVQYVRVGAPQIDASGRLSAFGYGRLSKQFGGEDDPLLGDDKGVLGRLYYLYLNYSLPRDQGEIRLGRQYVSVGAGAGTVDGIRAEVRNLGPVTVSAFAGYDVRFAETTDRTRDGNYLVGASAGGSFFKGNTVELSYIRKYDEGDTIREMAGAHVDQRFLGKAKAYADLRYDLLHNAYSEFLAGVKVFPFSAPATFTAEYFSSYPNFDADTIYTVFAVSRYWEALGRLDYIVNPEWTLYGSFTRADYDGPTADVTTLGVRTRPKQIEGFGANASVAVRRGYPGRLTGFQLSADYAYKKALLAAGLTYDVFLRDSMTEDFAAKRYWVGGSYEVRKDLTAKIRVEDNVTRQFANEFQGRASVDYRF